MQVYDKETSTISYKIEYDGLIYFVYIETNTIDITRNAKLNIDDGYVNLNEGFIKVFPVQT